MTSFPDDIDWSREGDRCVALLRDLIRIPTVNPPGNERPAAERVAEMLFESRVEPFLCEAAPGRTNLVARVRGTGEEPPLLLAAHLDVVEADASRWRVPPFSGDVRDGYVWGRGAVDMKNMAAMSACVVALIAESGARPRRDVVLACVADEEAGCAEGSMYLVREHADRVRAEYMLGEVGGFSLHLLGRTFYPIQVAEKGVVWVRATFRGEPGHGSMPREDSAVVRAAAAVARLGATRLPFHPTAAANRFVADLARALPLGARVALSQLGRPSLAGVVLDRLIKDPGQRRAFAAYLSNTASPTVVRAGAKTNVIPSEATVEIDGRTLPGQTEGAFLDELRAVLGADATMEVLRSLPPVETEPDTLLFRHLADTIRRHDPAGIPIPYLIPGFTDAKAFSRLGTRCYGFSPVRFDPKDDASFSRMYHGDDERIPEEGLRWGLRTLFDAVWGFAGPKKA